MKAEHARQLRLLDLQALDTRLAQIAHRRSKLSEQQVLDAALAERSSVDSELVKASMRQSDVQRDIAKAEADVQLVRDRAARDRARLESGSGSAKDLLGLQHELDSLARRQAALEDEQLEVMEHAEAVDSLVSHLTARLEQLTEGVAKATAARDAALGALEEEAGQVQERREQILPEVGDDLLALYEKIRAQTGMGAAAVVQRRCEGCRLELLGADVVRIAQAAPDEVVRCEECRRILVRTAESGL